MGSLNNMTLDELVREYILEAGESSMHKYLPYLQYGISGLRELHMDLSGVPKTVVLPVNDNCTVDLPDDYIQYTMIGVVDGSLCVQALGKLNKMALQRSYNDCGYPIAAQTTGSDIGYAYSLYGDGIADHSRNGELTGRFFGAGGGNNANGYYRIDKEMGVIQLSSDNNANQVVLEYISSLNKIDGDYIIDPFIYETLKAYIYWMSIRRKANIAAVQKQQAQQDFLMEKKKSNSRFQTFTMEEALAVIRRHQYLTPKS
jgi:hypothetical protein